MPLELREYHAKEGERVSDERDAALLEVVAADANHLPQEVGKVDVGLLL